MKWCPPNLLFSIRITCYCCETHCSVQYSSRLQTTTDDIKSPAYRRNSIAVLVSEQRTFSLGQTSLLIELQLVD